MPLNDDQLRAIGRITAYFNELEYTTNLFVYALVNRDLDIGRLVFQRQSLFQMLGWAKTLSKRVFRADYELCNRIEDWASRADDVRVRRNDALHGLWLEDQSVGGWVPLRLKGTQQTQVTVRATELERLADDIADVVLEISEILRTTPSLSHVR
jgi:hypothetical protein